MTDIDYSAFNTARSALSTIIPEKEGLAFGKQPVVKRLLKGIFRERPTLPRYTKTFNVDTNLSYLLTLRKPEDTGIKELSFRLATILFILSWTTVPDNKLFVSPFNVLFRTENYFSYF